MGGTTSHPCAIPTGHEERFMAKKYQPRHLATDFTEKYESHTVEEPIQETPQPSVRKSMFYSLLGNLIAPIAGLAIAPILSNSLGDAGRGALGGITSLVLVATAVGAFGMPEALTFHAARFVRRTGSVLKLVVGVLVLLGAVCAGVIYVLAPYLAADHGPWYAQLVVLTALAVVPNMLILIPRALVAATHQWHLQALEQGLFSLLRLGAILVLLWTGNLNVLSAVIVTLVTPVLGALVYVPMLVKIRQQKYRYSGEKQPVGEALGYGGKVWFGSLSGIVLSRIDQTLMIKLTTLQEQGLYAVAVTIGEVPSVISNAIRNVVFALDSRDSGDEDSAAAADQRLTMTARVTTLITLLISLPIALTAQWWIGPIFGQEFEAAVPMTWVLLGAAVIGSAGSVAGAGLSGRGHPDLRSWSMAIGAVFNLLVLITLTPHIGGMGAALSTLVGSGLAGFSNIVFLKLKFGFKIHEFYFARGADFALLGRAARAVLRKAKIMK